ncbi:uncharacterized iron-regulated protein [Janthinobacterium agaricidamnosum NBRC 102515 = DSM 9628]|uniref:Uncharacterized iron-regulated protein n=1 Tax=Janthinobacterium agaricidamnosum NBRC 102515 = DSM 9628 TaxID=1349767 RepID=W0V2J5_9BURK|nr:uncharacterized iron-regulated protein [Janthinobacterium agaricidamnosum NBRC 102515 = DSM 9628]
MLFSALALSACSFLKKQPDGPRAAPALPNPQVLLLGEVHDNAQGHKERFDDLRRRVEAGWHPAIAMEQFDQENQALLTRAQRDCPDAGCVIRVMEGKGWDWELYKPVIDLAIFYRLPLIAANLSRSDASRTVRDGVKTTFDAAAVQAYRLNDALPADIVAGQQKEIIAGHCNMLPDMMVGGMVHAQIARDIWMAKLIRAQAPNDVVLIAGNGHVRKDFGVARWLNEIAPKLTIRSVAYLEQAGPHDAAAFDVVHLIKAQQRPDPCAKFNVK